MVTAYIGVGSNIDAAENIRRGIELLNAAFESVTLSPVYQSPAIGFDGDPFLNLVAAIETELAPATLIKQLDDIEQQCARQRGDNSFAPRTLDLDLVLYGDLVNPGLRIPRQDVDIYAFVLKPLADIAPQGTHPINGKSYQQLWQAFDASEQPLTPVTL